MELKSFQAVFGLQLAVDVENELFKWSRGANREVSDATCNNAAVPSELFALTYRSANRSTRTDFAI